MVTAEHVKRVVAEETRNDEDVKQDALQLFSAFDTPRYRYDVARKSYEL